MKQALIFLALLVFAASSCKKDNTGNKNQTPPPGGTTNALTISTCAVYNQKIDYNALLLNYTASVVASDSAFGTLQLVITDSTGTQSAVVKSVDITMVKNDHYNFAFNGAIPSEATASPYFSFASYLPNKVQLSLQFVKNGSSTANTIAAGSCNNPVIAYVEDTLYGTANGIFVNANADSLSQTFQLFNATVLATLPGNSFTGYVTAQSGQLAVAYGGTTYIGISIPKNSHFTMFKSQSASYSDIKQDILVLNDTLTATDQSKAYVRFVNLYNSNSFNLSLKQDGNDIPQFDQKAYLDHSGFVAVTPGTSTYHFFREIVGSDLTTLVATTQAGKFYTIYMAGYEPIQGSSVPGKSISPRIISNN